MLFFKWVMRFWYRNLWVGYEECGERHSYLAVSGRYPLKNGELSGVVDPEVDSMKGVDGIVGSGVYTVDAAGESGDEKVVRIFEGHRKNGNVDTAWKHIEAKFRRMTGTIRLEV